MRSNPSQEQWVTFKQAAKSYQQWDVSCLDCGHHAVWMPSRWTQNTAPVLLDTTITDTERRLVCSRCGRSNIQTPTYATIRARNAYAPGGPGLPGNGVELR